MKKASLLFLALLVVLPLLFFTGCGKSKSEVSAPVATTVAAVSGQYSDGVYFAMEDDFDANGWKSTMTIVVQGGKIVDVDWNGVSPSATLDKKSYDQAGKYNMKRFANAQAEWYEQAQRVEDHIVKTQDVTSIKYKDNDGHTDAISGVSITVKEAYTLAQKALAGSAVGRGEYEDGAYFAIEEEYPAEGWKEYVSLTVVNGRVVAVNWSAIDRAGNDKKEYDKAGKYNMKRFANAQAEWYEQAQKVEEALIKAGGPKNANVDAVSGVSIEVAPFEKLASAALAAGVVKAGPYNDGTYYAEEAALDENGWKELVSLLVKNGNIVDVFWSGLNKDGLDKKEYDKAGNYNMVRFGRAQAEWYEQAERVEKALLASQNSSVDAVSGVSIGLDSFNQLVKQAFANGVKKQ